MCRRPPKTIAFSHKVPWSQPMLRDTAHVRWGTMLPPHLLRRHREPAKHCPGHPVNKPVHSMQHRTLSQHWHAVLERGTSPYLPSEQTLHTADGALRGGRGTPHPPSHPNCLVTPRRFCPTPVPASAVPSETLPQQPLLTLGIAKLCAPGEGEKRFVRRAGGGGAWERGSHDRPVQRGQSKHSNDDSPPALQSGPGLFFFHKKSPP